MLGSHHLLELRQRTLHLWLLLQWLWLKKLLLWCLVQTIRRGLREPLIYLLLTCHSLYLSTKFLEENAKYKHRRIFPECPSWKKLCLSHQIRGTIHQPILWCPSSSGPFCILSRRGACPHNVLLDFPPANPPLLDELALLARFHRKTPPLFGSSVDRGTFKRTIASFSKSINFNGISSVFRTILIHL